MLHLNILDGGSRIVPRLSIPVDQCPDLHAVFDRARECWGSLPMQATVSVLLPKGLTTVTEDTAWKAAILAVGATDWMDGELKVLVGV